MVNKENNSKRCYWNVNPKAQEVALKKISIKNKVRDERRLQSSIY